MEAMQSSPPCLTEDQSSSKRRRVDAADRLGDLPDCLLHGIISCLGSRQAVQTSVLSRRWRHLWRDVPCVAIDEREFVGDQWQRFEDFADHMLTSIPLNTRLDSFRLHLVTRTSMDGYATSDRWIRRGLRYFPAAVDIRTALGSTVYWRPHLSYPAAAASQQQPNLSVTGSCAAGFTKRLTTLRLVGVNLATGFMEDLGRHCPALEELHMEGCSMKLSAVTSPTLRTFVVIEARHSVPCVHLTIAAAHLAYLRLDIPYNGEECYCGSGEAAPEPLASMAEASIRLTETARQQGDNRARRKRKLEFLKSMRRFLGLLPNVTKLHLAGFTTKALLEEETEEFPVLHSLKTLLLEECDVGLRFQALTGILSNTPNLVNLGLHHCTFSAKKSRKRSQQPSRGRTSTQPIFWCKNLKSIDIKHRQEHASDIALVLSMISKGMQPAEWRQVKTSTILVQGT